MSGHEDIPNERAVGIRPSPNSRGTTGGRTRRSMTVSQSYGLFMRAGLYACDQHPNLRRAERTISALLDWIDPLVSGENIRRRFQGRRDIELITNTVRLLGRYPIQAAYGELAGRLGNDRLRNSPVPIHIWDLHLHTFYRSMSFLAALNGEQGLPRLLPEITAEAFVSALRSGKDKITRSLRDSVQEIENESIRGTAEVLVRIIDVVLEMLLRLIFAVTGMISGIGKVIMGMVTGIWGVITFLARIILLIILPVIGTFSEEARILYMEQIRAMRRLSRDIRAAWQDYRRRFQSATEDQQTFMLGEFFGEILTMIAATASIARSTGNMTSSGGSSMMPHAGLQLAMASGRTPAMQAIATSTAGVEANFALPAMAVSNSGQSGQEAPGSGGRSRGTVEDFRRRIARPPQLIRLSNEFIERWFGRHLTAHQITLLNRELENLWVKLGEDVTLMHQRIENIEEMIRLGGNKIRIRGRESPDTIAALIQLENRRIWHEGMMGGSTAEIRGRISLAAGAQAERRAVIQVFRDSEVRKVHLAPDQPGPDMVVYYRGRSRSSQYITASRHERLEVVSHLPSNGVTPESLANAITSKIRRGQLADPRFRYTRQGTIFLEIQDIGSSSSLLDLTNEALLILRQDSSLLARPEVRRIIVAYEPTASAGGSRILVEIGKEGSTFQDNFSVIQGL